MRSADAPLRVLIADDEAPARRQLSRALQAIPDVLIVGEACDGLEALRLVESLQPDLLLLDIQMPQMSGIDVASNLQTPSPLVVFVTAFDEHALRAFDLAAVDYLLKPWANERLLHALERARERLGRSGGRHELRPAVGPVQRIVVRQRDTLVLVACQDVQSIAAQDNYVELHTAERDWLLREPLGALLERLQHPDIVRVHRSHAANLQHVVAYTALSGGDGQLTLTDDRRIPCSRTYRDAVVHALVKAQHRRQDRCSLSSESSPTFEYYARP